MSETPITNEEKRQVYAALSMRLRTAVSQEFYFEAMLLEYSIIEDRLSSVLKHSGIRHTKSNGDELNIQKKLDKINNAIRSKVAPIFQKVSQELIDEIEAWKEIRNTLVHRSCQRLYDSEEVKCCALTGKELVRKLSNTAAAVKREAQKLEKHP